MSKLTKEEFIRKAIEKSDAEAKEQKEEAAAARARWLRYNPGDAARLENLSDDEFLSWLDEIRRQGVRDRAETEYLYYSMGEDLREKEAAGKTEEEKAEEAAFRSYSGEVWKASGRVTISKQDRQEEDRSGYGALARSLFREKG